MSDTVIDHPSTLHHGIARRVHAKRRAEERYNATLTDADFARAVADIKARRYNEMLRQNETFSAYSVLISRLNKVFDLVFDHDYEEIVTFLPQGSVNRLAQSALWRAPSKKSKKKKKKPAAPKEIIPNMQPNYASRLLSAVKRGRAVFVSSTDDQFTYRLTKIGQHGRSACVIQGVLNADRTEVLSVEVTSVETKLPESGRD